MNQRDKTCLYILGATALAIVIMLSGCVAGGMPDIKNIPPGAKVVAEQSNPTGSSKTTIEGGPEKQPVTAETLEDGLNVCLGRHPPEQVVRLCGCLERRGLSDTREFQAYCISERTDPEPPQAAEPEVIETAPIYILPGGERVEPPDSPATGFVGEGKASALANAQVAVGDAWDALPTLCQVALADVLRATDPDWRESVLEALPSVVRRPVQWVAWLEGGNFDQAWTDETAARQALAAARQHC